MPLEYAIANCDPIVVELMVKLKAKAAPNDMLRMAICRRDVQILALVLVSLIEDRQLLIDQDSDVLTLAVEKQCPLDMIMMLC